MPTRRYVHASFDVIRVLVRALLNVAVYGILLFVPAGTLQWPRAWVVLGLVLGAMIATRVLLLRSGTGVLDERRLPPFQSGQPFADKVLVVAFLLVFPLYLGFIPLDVFHWHIWTRPSPALSMFGLAAFSAGEVLVALAFRENAFAAPIVKSQTATGQRVVKTGVYALVRHPLYTGVVCIVIGLALWLQSLAALAACLFPIALIVARILVEERFLRDHLAGYEAYTERVRHRLVPLVW